jgi:acyl-CoA hydrolase
MVKHLSHLQFVKPYARHYRAPLVSIPRAASLILPPDIYPSAIGMQANLFLPASARSAGSSIWTWQPAPDKGDGMQANESHAGGGPMFEAFERIYLPGACGEPTCLLPVVFEADQLDITTGFAPGINTLTSEMIRPGSRVTGLFMQSGLRAAQRDRRFRHIPLSYFAMVKRLRESPAFDTCLVQVSPPDAKGRCSLGPAAEFTPEIMRRARRIVAAVNAQVPRVPNAATIALADCAVVVEADTPLAGYDVGDIDSVTETIAQRVAGRIGDGAALQVGLGKVPHALMAALKNRRGLRLHSGMLSDGVIELAASGALDRDWEHVTTVVVGKPELYRWIADRHDIHVRGIECTHDPVRLASIGNFISVNSALEVDLFGQCNLEFVAGRVISGAGGAPDFSRAARLSAQGLSIVALPATFGGGKGSRIRPWLGAGSTIAIPRNDVDLVVTEFGVADLRGLSVHERAEQLIAIAAPFARDALAAEWERIAGEL